MRRTIHCLFSGGRDSAVACFIAKRVADIRGWNFRLVHIDTGIRLPDVEPYVEKYAKWLGAELVVLHTDFNYWDGCKEWGYPLLWHNRWCKRLLKEKPLSDYLWREYKPIDVVVMGIRKDESLFRKREFNKTFYKYRHRDGLWVNYWLPVLYADGYVINKLIRKYGIPISPVWVKVGISGECMCMAGMSKSTLDKVIDNYPEFAMEMAKMDEEVQKARYSDEPSYPAPLVKIKITLHDYVHKRLEERKKQKKITSFFPGEEEEGEIPYVGASCQGSCIIDIRELFDDY